MDVGGTRTFIVIYVENCEIQQTFKGPPIFKVKIYFKSKVFEQY